MSFKQRKKRIPEVFGNGVCGVWPYIVALILNALIHIIFFVLHGFNFYNFTRLFLSFLFFIYPFYYTADVLWSLQPSVCGILSGKLQINRKYYMNFAKKEVESGLLLPVTISIPVYTESNDVIFETIRQSISAIKRYYKFSNKPSNIIVSDDGIAVMLNGSCTKEKADYIVKTYLENKSSLSENEVKAAQRIIFCRENKISFVVRPKENRAGLFKKASNLNYTLRLGNYITKGNDIDLINTEFKDGYYEGNVITNEIILLLDKDSGVNERIIEFIVPEFGSDEKLAYVQCATKAENMYDNYYSYATGHQINNLFHNIWPCKALQGYFVPLIGHNVFIRKSILEKSGLWSENKVSEDYDKAICFYNMGYHGKYAQIKGLEFTEYASRTFVEETGRQRRYSYGLFEMIFDGTIALGKSRKCDMFYMILYFFSTINQVMLIPTVLFECYFGNIYTLWAGFIFCNIAFIVLPGIRGIIMHRRLPKEYSEKFIHTLIIAFSFVGHSFSIFCGAFRYFINKVKKNLTPFPSTNVDKFEYCFNDGIKLMVEYFKNNKAFLLIAILCLDRGIFLITRKGIPFITQITYCYILFFVVFIPFLLTPQLFSGLKLRMNFAFPSRNNKYFDDDIYQYHEIEIINSEIEPDSLSSNKEVDDDIRAFLNTYDETLQEILLNEDIPKEITENYTFESCIRKDDEGKKEIYLLRRKKDNVKVLLRITKNYPEEDAVEEAKLLKKLNHPSIPKVYAYYEQNEKKYILREYIEGNSLYDVVKSRGILNIRDIYKVIIKLTDTLKYLHSQNPPVIHRDIKPQNIIVGKDGNIHLIDFGIARLHKERRKQDTSVILTLDYASPEQYGFAQTTPLSDIYSLGVVTLFMATGNTIKSDLESQIVNNNLRYMIERCIDFNPKSRFQRVDEIQEYIKNKGLKSSDVNKKWKLGLTFVVVSIILSIFSYNIGIYFGRNKGENIGYDKGYFAGYADSYELMPTFKANSTYLDEKNIINNMFVNDNVFTAYYNDLIFYIHEGDIYKMSDNGINSELLINDTKAEMLSFDNGWIYYSSGSKIIQINLYTLESHTLYENIPGKLYVIDDNYYIRNNNGLYKLDISNGNMTLLNSLNNYKQISVFEEKLYFIDNQKLFSSDLNGDNVNEILGNNVESFCIFEDYIFVIVKNGNLNEVVKININDYDVLLLAEINASKINVTNKGIYFIDDFDNTLNVYSLDGKIQTKISKNRALDFNVIGDWIFYHNSMDNNRLWCIRVDGTNDHPIQGRES